MAWANIEGDAGYLLKMAGLVDFVRVPVRPAAEALLGNDCLFFVPRSRLGSGQRAAVRTENGRRVIKVANDTQSVMRWSVAHELGHVVLEHSDVRDDWMEQEADRFAAALLMPWRAFGLMRDEFGDDLEALANVFQVSQTAVALRLGEVGGASAVVVVTPEHVRARAFGQMELPTPDDWRDYARMTDDELRRVGPGIRKTEITDGWRRVALMVEEDVG